MEHHNAAMSTINEKSSPIERLSTLEWLLLSRFRGLEPQDQAVVFKMIEGLSALMELDN
ncbi:hypothetical protein [Pseudomonas citronellolis]|uniref:hypothetical protein n=1 Tax=Pseudomonas citronellolis TaxID=53408 RepID=UPI0022BA5604|nr:hypothetical protein [Pseudomonas citronellolis]